MAAAPVARPAPQMQPAQQAAPRAPQQRPAAHGAAGQLDNTGTGNAEGRSARLKTNSWKFRRFSAVRPTDSRTRSSSLIVTARSSHSGLFPLRNKIPVLIQCVARL